MCMHTRGRKPPTSHLSVHMTMVQEEKWDGKQRFNTFSSEHETLFQRGTLMRITRMYQVGCTTFIDCEVIGQEVKPLSYVTDSNIGY